MNLSFFALRRMFCVLVIIRDKSHSFGGQRFRVIHFHFHKIMSTVSKLIKNVEKRERKVAIKCKK